MLELSFDDARGYSKDVIETLKEGDPGAVQHIDNTIMDLRRLAANFGIDLTDAGTLQTLAQGMYIGSQLTVDNLARVCENPEHPLVHLAQGIHLAMEAVDQLGVLPPAVRKDRRAAQAEVLRSVAEAVEAGTVADGQPLSDEEFEAELRREFGEEPGEDR